MSSKLTSLQTNKLRLQHFLDKMIEESREKAIQQNKQLHHHGLVGRGWMYTKEYLEGLYDMGESTVSGMVKLVEGGGKLCGELMWDIASARIDDLKKKLHQAKHIFKLADQDVHTIHLLLSDADIRKMLVDFVRRYFAAESSLDFTHMAGALSFNVLLFLMTAAGGKMLDVATAGFAAEASDAAIDASDTVRVVDMVDDVTDVASDMQKLDVQGILASRYVRDVIEILQDIAKELEHIHKVESLAEETDEFLHSSQKKTDN